MKCIYCDTNNKYQDRRNGKCKKCGKPFAFEPKTMNPSLRVTDKRFQAAINAVSGGGRLFFTSRQLYYQLIRREGQAPIGYQDFQVRLQHRWIQAHGRPEKLLESTSTESRSAARAEPDIHQYSFDRLLVVDRAETAGMLLANNLHFETSMPILSADGYPREVFATVMAMVRRNPQLRVFALHDADVEGCRLPLLLRERSEWFPSPSVAVLDLGLRPMQIAASPRFIEQKDDPPREIPPDLTRNLSPGERRWLAAGNRGELAFFPPDRIMKTLYRMIQSAEKQEGAVRRWAAFDLRGFCQTALPGARFAGFGRDARAAEGPAGTLPGSALPGGALRSGVSRVAFSDRVTGPDGTVERRYTNGTIERRVVAGPGEIAWTDDRGASGRDYNLGDGQVLRRADAGGSALGRQIGFGVTCWNDGARVTVNETPLPERAPEPPPPSFLGRCAAGLGLGGVFGVGSIRAGKRRIRPGSDEFPLYAEQAMMRRWMEARRASGAPYVGPGPYFWVSTPAPPPDTAVAYSSGSGDGGDGGFWGDASGDAATGTGIGSGWDAQGADSGSWGIGGGWDAGGGGDAGGGWDGGDGDGFG